jgi:hypothetical protein
MSLPDATDRLRRSLDSLESAIMPISKARSPKLDERPARDDLTSREVAKLLGGMIGSLCHMANVAEVRTAVEWWGSASDETWAEVARMGQQARRAHPCGS